MKQFSEALYERALKVAPGGVHSPVRSFKGMGRTPIFFERAEGCKLHSVEGKTYIDFCQSFGPLILGHLDPEVHEEVRRMIDTAWTFGACEPYSLELAEWITSRLPWMQKLRFVSSGTEAVMSALRLVRAVTGRKKIVKFEGCYHGHVDAMLVQAGSGLAGQSAASSAGIPEEAVHHTLVCPLDDEVCLQNIFDIHGDDIAALIIEPLPANYGLLKQRQTFLQLARNLTQQHQSLLIFDEVISGFRVALGGMVEKTGVIPDLVCYGKIIGGGFPVGCYGGKSDLMDWVAPLGKVYQAGTLSANPVGMRAGLATLQKMERMGGWKILDKRTDFFCERLLQELNQQSQRWNVTREGSIFWIHGYQQEPIRRIDQIPSQHTSLFQKLFLKCLERGIYLAPNAYEVGFVGLAHSEEILSHAIEKITEAAYELGNHS